MKPLSRLLVVASAGLMMIGGYAGVGCATGGTSEDVATSSSALSAPDVLGFETPAGWTVTQGSGVTLTQSTQHVQGSFSLGVASPGGFIVLTSAALSSADITVSSPIGFDLLQPTQQVNPFFLGAVQLFIEVPSLNLFNQFIGQVQLTGLPTGVFQRIEFTIPPALLARLRSATFNDLVYRIALNVPNGDTGTYLLDAFDGARDAGADAGADANDAADTDANDANDADANDADANDANDADANDADANDADANDADAGNPAAAFPGQVVAALCQKRAQCCAQIPNMGFDVGACTADPVNQFGWRASNFGSEFIDGGNVVLNPSLASACLADIQAIDCATNGLTSAASTALYHDCYGALQGTLPVDGGCHDAIECAPGEFCDLPTDGGPVGACSPLRAVGQPCGDFGVLEDQNGPTTPGFVEAISACSYRGSGAPPASCEVFTLDDAGALLPEDQWVCNAAGPLGAFCSTDLDCNSFVCDPNTFTCTTASTFSDPSECTPLTDAGDGG